MEGDDQIPKRQKIMDEVEGGEGESITDLYQFTSEQKTILLDEAKSDGFWTWVQRYAPIFGLASLFSILGHELAIDLRSAESDELLPLLKALFVDKAKKRQRIEKLNTFDDAVELIANAKNIIVLTGAGVSVSCGIPDFRSKNGIYSRLQEFELTDPQEMFDLHYFKFRPQTFYSFAKEIYPSNFVPSLSHRFIKLLEEKGKLLRCYTQNIDTLENLTGITRVVQCHGSFATASCVNCKYQIPGTDIKADIFDQVQDINVERIIKPDIVFFGENLPNEFHSKFKKDVEKVDLLIVMGSSLQVAPVANVKDRIPSDVPQILINMESLPHMDRFDIHLLGYSDVITQALADQLNWKLPPAISKMISTPLVAEEMDRFSEFPMVAKSIYQDESLLTSKQLNSELYEYSCSSSDATHKKTNQQQDIQSTDKKIEKLIPKFATVGFNAGSLPWIWIFDGAIQAPVPSSASESSEESGDSCDNDSINTGVAINLINT